MKAVVVRAAAVEVHSDRQEAKGAIEKKGSHEARSWPHASPVWAEIEREVVGEAREWGRQRLQERLQQLAREEGQVSPPGRTPAPPADPAQ